LQFRICTGSPHGSSSRSLLGVFLDGLNVRKTGFRNGSIRRIWYTDHMNKKRFSSVLVAAVVVVLLLFGMTWYYFAYMPATIPSMQTGTSTSSAQENTTTCGGAEVRSIVVSADVQRTVSRDARPANIEIVPAQASAAMLGVAEKAITVIAYGPVLGSMDSRKLKTDLVCTANGFVLTATITRSANFNGAALQNVNWYPRITIAVVLHEPEVVFQTTWRMRLTTSAELDHAQTPPYPDQRYPITLTKMIE
jgi:hypothetical protein